MIVIGALILLVTVVVLVHDYVRKCSYRWKMLSQFPGDPPLPIIGNALDIGFDSDEASHKIMTIWKKHGRRNFRMTVGSEDWVFLTDPDDVETLLKNPTELSKALERNMAIIPFFGHSVSTSEGERWRSTRKLMVTSFSLNKVEVNKYCERLFNVLDNLDPGAPIDMYRYIRPYMYDLLCNTLLGVEHDFLNNPDHPYMKCSGKIIKIITENYFSHWRKYKPLAPFNPVYNDMMEAIRVLEKTSHDIIKERKNKLDTLINNIKDNNKNATDFDIAEVINSKLSDEVRLLDKFLFMLSSGKTPYEFVKEETTFLCFTGHYTTSMTISHTLYYLSKYPLVQRKALEEQLTIFDDDLTRMPTSQDLNQMKYLENVVKESMRFLPTITKIARQLKRDLIFKDGRVAPAGSTVIVFYDAMFADPKIFPEPVKFNPDRFNEPMHTYAYTPFSAGPRGCIGFRYAWVAMKTTLSNMLRRYEILPGVEPDFKFRIITESTNGIQLRLKRRKI